MLLAYLNRTDLRYDLQEVARQLADADGDDTPGRSVKTQAPNTRRHLGSRLTDDQVRELIATYQAGGITRVQLAERYGIGRTSVAKLLREWRQGQIAEGAAE